MYNIYIYIYMYMKKTLNEARASLCYMILCSLMWNPYIHSGISILLDNHKIPEFLSTQSPSNSPSLRWLRLSQCSQYCMP